MGIWNVGLMEADMVARGWKQDDLARKAGVSQPCISRLFSGGLRRLRADTAAPKVAKALRRSVKRYLVAADAAPAAADVRDGASA